MTTPRGEKSIPHNAPELGPPCSVKKKKTSEVEDEAAVQLSASIKSAITRCVESGSLPQDLDFPQVSVRKVTENTRGKLKGIEGQLDYTSSTAFAIAAAVKRKRSKASTEMEVESGIEVNRLQLLSSQQEFSASLVAEIVVSQLRDTNAISGYIPQACKGHLNFLAVGCRVEGNSPSSGKGSPVLSLTTEGKSGYPYAGFDSCSLCNLFPIRLALESYQSYACTSCPFNLLIDQCVLRFHIAVFLVSAPVVLQFLRCVLPSHFS